MPKLEAFNRKWGIGSDDFVFSGSIDIFGRMIALLVLLMEFWLYQHELHKCEWGDHIRVYLIGIIIQFALIIPTDVIIVRTSMKGTIVDSEPRKNIPRLLYIRSVFVVMEVIWTILGTDWALQKSQDCGARVAWVATLAVAGGWVSLIAHIVGVMIVFDMNNKGSHQEVVTKQDWEKRWQIISCCVQGSRDNNQVYSKLANLCSDFFKELDIVSTDTFAGLILVHKQQKRKRSQDLKSDSVNIDMTDGLGLLTSRAKRKNLPTPRPWMTLTLMSRMMEFAFGSYGWFYFIGMNNPIVATFKLMIHTKCFTCRSSYKQIHKDNRCHCNTTAFRITTGLEISDIVYATHHNEINAIPFYVSIDKTTKSVVVSIRGSLSLEDIITDLGVERTPLDIPGISEAWAHQGMLESALYIKRTLEEAQILEEAFTRAEGYRLVITGHSLGAGAGALLAILLKPKYPDVICFSYAPPGELVSENVLEYTHDFICSVVLGDDIVPRLGLLEGRRLKIQVLKALHDCSLPKHEVLASGVWKRLFRQRMEDHIDGCMGRDCSYDEPDGPHLTSFQRYLQETIQEERRKTEESLKDYHPLVPPGQILHVLETKSSRKRKPEYYAVWTDETPFREIVLNSKMIAHHFPDTLLDALRQLQIPELPLDKKLS